MMIYNSSIDGGNSGIKVIVEGTHKFMYSNIVANSSKVDYDLVTGRDQNYGSKKTTGKNMLDVSVTHQFDKENSKEERFLFDSMAEGYRDSLRNRSNTNKCNDTQLINSMISALAFSLLRFKQKAGDKITPKMTIRANIATGLPYHEWKNKIHRKTFKENLEGNHKVKFNHPFFKGLEIELIIEYAHVLVEGESTLNLLTSDEESEYQTTSAIEMIENVIVIVDMGAFTTEIVAKQFLKIDLEDDDLEDDDEIEVVLETMPNLTKGVPDGVGLVMEDTIIDIEKNETVDPLIRRDIERAFSKEGVRQGKSGYLVGTEINITDYFTIHAKRYATKIAQEFYGLYNTTQVKNKIKKIYITGGGSKSDIIVNEFKEILEEQGYETKSMVTLREPDPIYSNAFGYYVELINHLEEIEESEEIA